MRIEQLILERYGRFTDRTLAFRSGAPLHVVLGSNESGKTTALSAIADLLFGFGHQTEYDFLHDGRTLRIGAALRLGDGSGLSFRRRKGNKNTLIDADDRPLPDDLLSPVTGNLTRDSFSREFGLTAAALRDGGAELLKAGGRLAETLAAGSAGLSALSRLRGTLSAEADDLFTLRKSAGKAFYMAADRYATADSHLKAAIVTADALQEADARIAEKRQYKEDLTRQHETAGRELRRLERCARTSKALGRLDHLASALTAFADLPAVPAEVLADWREAHAADRDAAKALRDLDEADARDKAAIDALGVDEALLAQGAVIDALRERLGAVRKAIADLPKRLEAQRHAEAELDDLARRLGLASAAALLETRPADPALAQVRALVEARTRSEDRLAEAEDALRKARGERDAVQAQIGPAAYPTDPAVFRQRLEAVDHVPGDAGRLRRESQECDTEHEAVNSAARGLNPPVETAKQLAALPLPEETEIAAQARTLAEIAAEDQAARAGIEAAQRKIADTTSRIDGLARQGVGATLADMHAARRERDTAFDSLQAVLDGDAIQRHDAFGKTRQLTGETDRVTDQLLGDSERAGLRQAAEDQLEAARHELDEASSRLKEVDGRRSSFDEAWRALWLPSSLVPRSPAEMTRWRQHAEALLERQTRLAARRAELRAVSDRLDQARSALVRLMADFGRTADPQAAAEILYREAAGWLGALQEAWTTARERDVALKAAAAKLAEAEVIADKARRQLGEIAGQWPAAIAAIGLGATASLAEVRAALEVWQRVGEPRQSLERERRSVAGIEADIASFSRDVAAVAASGGESVDADVVLPRLAKALAEARNADGQREGLKKAVGHRQSTRAGLQSKRQALAGMLVEARNRLDVSDDQALAAAIERLSQRQLLETELAKETAALLDMGDGLDEARLRAEQAGTDPDMLPGEIARLELEARGLLAAINEASAELSHAEKDRDTLARGRDAPGAAREREEAAAELLSIARRWVVRAAASRLASRAIEHHRQANQDPVLARAGDLFRLATAQSFSGLAADYDETDRPALVAVRQDGERVPVPGLSEGTRDQLFLALRLALLEQRSAEPLPFIADDLLSSFDDTRTSRVLALLKDFGGHQQVIVFTHHDHVANLAQAEVPDADIIEL